MGVPNVNAYASCMAASVAECELICSCSVYKRVGLCPLDPLIQTSLHERPIHAFSVSSRVSLEWSVLLNRLLLPCLSSILLPLCT